MEETAEESNKVEEQAERSNKVTGIRQIVRLKEILNKWQNVTIGAKARNDMALNNQQEAGHPGGIPPELSKRLISDRRCDSDEEQSPEPAHGVPKGYLAVYIGPELRRFIIPTSYLSDPLFKVLLEKVEEEFGFDHTGALTIPCETETFKYLLQCMENHQKENNICIPPENNNNNIDIPSENNNTSESPEVIESSARSESPGTSSQPVDE